jgi:pyrroline-5-carboxylate reductase
MMRDINNIVSDRWKIGIIGLGNIGGIFAGKIATEKVEFLDEIYLFDISKEKTFKCAQETGGNKVDTLGELTQKSDIIIMAVKPNIVESVLNEVKLFLDDKKIIISVAAAISINFMERICGENKKIVRTMPNTPALIGEGVTAVCRNRNVNDNEIDRIRQILELVGIVEFVEEKFFDVITATTGSSPAYVFMFIEAMADAAVYCGMSRDQAYRVVSEAVAGAAKMVSESKKHPGELKDQVCTPAGTTIEAIRILEKNAFRHSVFEAVVECSKKANEIEKFYKK